MSSTEPVASNPVVRQWLCSLFAGGALFAAAVATAASPPAAPSHPGATANSSTSIEWSWQDNSSNETGFSVWTDPGMVTPSTLGMITPANTTSWTQTALTANSLYSFQVAATNLYGRSAKTIPLSVWTLAAPPVAPLVKSSPAFEIAVGPGDGNPAYTLYAIQCATNGLWLQAQGSLGMTPQFQTASAWGSTVVKHTLSAAPSFSVCAQNGAGIWTAMGPSTCAPVLSHLLVTPVRACAGDTVTITFTVSEPLDGEPTVTVNGYEATLVSDDGDGGFTYQYVVQAGDPPGMATIAVSCFNLAGNLGSLSNDSILQITEIVPNVPLRAWPAGIALLAAGVPAAARRARRSCSPPG